MSTFSDPRLLCLTRVLHCSSWRPWFVQFVTWPVRLNLSGQYAYKLFTDLSPTYRIKHKGFNTFSYMWIFWVVCILLVLLRWSLYGARAG